LSSNLGVCACGARGPERAEHRLRFGEARRKCLALRTTNMTGIDEAPGSYAALHVNALLRGNGSRLRFACSEAVRTRTIVLPIAKYGCARPPVLESLRQKLRLAASARPSGNLEASRQKVQIGTDAHSPSGSTLVPTCQFGVGLLQRGVCNIQLRGRFFQLFFQ
jgi:hypothetical protein